MGRPVSVASYLIGDVFDVLATMPDDSVDLILTSPPFLALRSYLPADHPDKHKEIGSEPTPAEFLDTLLALTAEWGRVLAPACRSGRCSACTRWAAAASATMRWMAWSTSTAGCSSCPRPAMATTAGRAACACSTAPCCPARWA